MAHSNQNHFMGMPLFSGKNSLTINATIMIQIIL